MKCKNIIDFKPFQTLYEKDENGREINLYKFTHVSPYGNTFYPNCLFLSEDIINFSTEKIMSLDIETTFSTLETDKMLYKIDIPVFYFVYNTDNYYHFVYDSLPYLISYFELKKQIPELKLLMNYPNSSKKEFYRFVTEFLELLNITSDDILIIKEMHEYKEIYVSNSYTHGYMSNLPPRKEIYDFYKKMVDNAVSLSNIDIDSLPKKIYVSRRTWVHGDTSNIGTNYTMRRRLECEDELVYMLNDQNVKEVFTEQLSTVEKIIMFNNAELVVGAIGGGLCNVLFGKPSLNLLCLVSPTFLEVNYRFKYCFDKVKCFYFDETYHTETLGWKKWMRVKTDNIVGEIEDIEDDYLIICYTDENVAGWNSEMQLNRIKVRKDVCTPLDNGLNSAWNFSLQHFYMKFFRQ